METSSISIPHPPPPALLIRDQGGDPMGIIEICTSGDTVLNIRRLVGWGGSGAEKPLARFRVSSAQLQRASNHVKNSLDPTLGSLAGDLASAPTKKTAGFPTGLSPLWVHMDANQELNVFLPSKATGTLVSIILEDSSGMSHEGIKALTTLLRILHFELDSKDSIKTEVFNVGVMTALVAEIACGLGCVDLVVPWINLWLTRDLPGMYSWDWYCTTEGLYAGIVLGYTMGDKTAFQCWSKFCIRYGRDSDSFTGLGCVWSSVHHDLQTRRREHVKELLAVFDQTWDRYCVEQSTTAQTLAHSISLGVFALAVHHHFGHPPPFVNIPWQGSLDDLMLVFQDIQKRMNTVWEEFSFRVVRYGVQKPADVFWEKAETVWVGVEGLDLEDYRPDVEKLLDVGTLLRSSIPWQSDAKYYYKVELEAADRVTVDRAGLDEYETPSYDGADW